jgi:Toxin SymE, type I toxin-antitoxin system
MILPAEQLPLPVPPAARPATAPPAPVPRTARTLRRARVVSYWGGREPVPMLRLRGKWLRAAGFALGRRLEVQVAAEELVIRPAPE